MGVEIKNKHYWLTYRSMPKIELMHISNVFLTSVPMKHHHTVTVALLRKG